MIIDHIGIVVRSIEKGIEQWEKHFGYQQMTEIVENTRQKVNVVFMSKKNSLTINLIAPTDKSSPVFEVARKGAGLHHLCFKCDDMNTEIERLSSEKLRLLTPPEPGEAFENENIAFFSGKQGLNIELIDTDKRANRIIKE